MSKEMTNGRIAEVACHIRGTVPCIMSNGAMADPTYKWAKIAKEIRTSVKRGQSMTEAQAEQYYHALFIGQLYLLDGEKTPYWPAENVEGLIRRGAMKSKKGQTAKISISAEGNYPLLYDGPKTGEGLWKDEKFVFKSRIQSPSGTTINCRCRFPVWEFKFEVLLDLQQANVSELKRWLTDAGDYVGLSAWTPKYGRYEVLSVE